MRFCAAAASILFAFPSEGVCAFFTFVRSCAGFEADVQIWVATLVIHLSCSLQAYRTTSTSSQLGEKVAKFYLPAHSATLILVTQIKLIIQTLLALRLFPRVYFHQVRLYSQPEV